MINFANVFSYVSESLDSSLKFELFPPLRNAETCTVLYNSSCNTIFVCGIDKLSGSQSRFLIFSNPVGSKRLLNFDSCSYFVHYYGKEHHKNLIPKI